jgi:RNA polymerase II elongation factor ELL
MRNAGHRRVSSKSFMPNHLAPSGTGSPLLSVPSSPMGKKPPTSQPGGANQAILTALRVPIIHLLAMQPAKESHLAQTCRTSVANVRDLLPKIAKHTADDAEKWQLTDKSFREIDPYKFPYKTQDDREQAIRSAIKSFDRLRLSKEDKLWQILLPRDERGQGKCLSRLNVKAVEKPQKASTPLHKMSKSSEKKPVAKKAADKDVERKAKDAEAKPKKPVKERLMKPLREPAPAKSSPLPAKNSPAPAATSTPKLSVTASSNRTAPADANKIRPKKVAPPAEGPSPRVKPKMPSRDLQQHRPFRPTKPVNTKPKNPSPLSASPPVNASDFEHSHPVHKALSGAPSPAKTVSGNSDRPLKRKANDLDSDIHNHNLAVKKPHVERSTPNGTPANANGRAAGNTPSATNSLKRGPDGSSSATSTKVRKVNNIDTSRAARYPQSTHISPGDSSSSQTSPTLPSLSFRQTVELSQKFQRYYKKYEALYWKLTESATPPSQPQRDDLLKMHKKLEEMKREIKTGAGAHR